MKLNDYLKHYSGKRIYVLGLGVSNRPLVRLLCEAGLDVTACDKSERETIPDVVAELESYGAKLRLGKNYLKDAAADVVFRTPVMLPTTPEVSMFINQGAEISSEMELFFEVCPCRIIAVTGSDGKTTTTTLIHEMLKAAGYKTWIGGNIGTPLLEKSDEMTPDDMAIVELSSFQLMDMRRSPDIAVMTNLAPNHLDHHTDMQEYVDSKKNIFLHQNAQGILVLNKDNEITNGMAVEAKGSVRGFSRKETVTNGAYFENDIVYYNGKKLMEKKDILIPGIHNVENYMAAITAVRDFVSDDVIRSVANTFGGVEHRIELVREKDGVKYYNDSIASSPSRTIAGLVSFNQKVILIAGGYDKNIPFDSLGPVICDHVKKLVLTGATAKKIKASVLAAGEYCEAMPEIIEIEDFYEAVRKASEISTPGDVVILSPAGAAFDKFKNFAVRGKEFKRTVMEL